MASLAACGGEPTAVPPPPATLRGEIMFWSNRDNVDDLWLVGADHSPARRFILDSVARQHPRISPDGSHILYSGHYKGVGGLYVMTNLGAEDHAISSDTTDAEPTWSPDGQEIAFSSYRGTGRRGIYRMGAEGSDAVRLTPATWNSWNPEWAPDGSRIAFVSDQATLLGSTDLFVMNADGTGITQLTTTGLVVPARLAWSADGRTLLYSSSVKGDPEIYALDVATLATTRLTTAPGADWGPSWSPDGSRIAFSSGRGGTPSIYVMNADGTGAVPYTSAPDFTSDEDPDWCRLP